VVAAPGWHPLASAGVAEAAGRPWQQHRLLSRQPLRQRLPMYLLLHLL
jgi:hypothetical protein